MEYDTGQLREQRKNLRQMQTDGATRGSKIRRVATEARSEREEKEAFEHARG
jgi:hypothetical protein